MHSPGGIQHPVGEPPLVVEPGQDIDQVSAGYTCNTAVDHRAGRPRSERRARRRRQAPRPPWPERRPTLDLRRTTASGSTMSC